MLSFAFNPERVIVKSVLPVIDAAAVVMTMEVTPGVLIGVKATPAVEIVPVGVLKSSFKPK